MSMSIYEYKAHAGLYLYRLKYSEHEEGWRVDAVQILMGSRTMSNWVPVRGFYASDSQALAQGIEHCEALVAQLNTENLPR